MTIMRIVIIRKDIERLKGCSRITALRLIKAIKDSMGKSDKQSISIREFCEYEGLDYNEVIEQLGLK
jgi:hypothetical protein